MHQNEIQHDFSIERNEIGVTLKKRELILGICFLPFYYYIIQEVLSFIIIKLYNNNIISYIDSSLYNFIFYIIISVFLIAIFFSFLKNSLVDFFKYKLFRAKWFFVSLGIIYLGNIVVNVLVNIITGEVESANNEAVSSNLVSNPILMIICTVILAPLCEELIFRALIFGQIYKINKVLAHVVNILLFSLLHVWAYLLMGEYIQLVHMIRYFPGAFGMAFCYEKSKSIYASILVHMTINAIACVLILLFDFLKSYGSMTI